MYRTAISIGSAMAALGVILGAFGAHGLRKLLPIDQLQGFETGVRYQMYHAFAMILAGIIYQSYPARQVKLASSLFLTGIILFSGSLYIMTLLKINGQVGIGGLGMLTPVGGIFFILGWVMLLAGILKKKN